MVLLKKVSSQGLASKVTIRLNPAMPMPLKGSFLIAHYDCQYRWRIRSTGANTELRVERTELNDGQTLVAICPKVFNPDFVVQSIDEALELGWKSDVEGLEDFVCRLTRRGLKIEESRG